jgi:hypothetical protein
MSRIDISKKMARQRGEAGRRLRTAGMGEGIPSKASQRADTRELVEAALKSGSKVQSLEAGKPAKIRYYQSKP